MKIILIGPDAFKKGAISYRNFRAKAALPTWTTQVSFVCIAKEIKFVLTNNLCIFFWNDYA